MYRNYKCVLDFDIEVSDECIYFLKSILSKDPKGRLSADRAIEEEIIYKLELDENVNSKIHALCKKMPKRPL